MMSSIIPYLYVALGGAVGSSLRFGVTQWLGRDVEKFPLETLFVNVTSSFVMGALAALAIHKADWFNNEGRFLLMSGFCGGYSTLAALSHQTLLLLQLHNWWYAALNIFSNILLSMVAICLAYWTVAHEFH